MERVKAIRRNASAAANADDYRPELLTEDEPRYLRRQKPVEIRRRKFSGKSWPFYRTVLVWGAVGVAGISAAVMAGRYLLYSPKMLLVNLDQVEILPNRSMDREATLHYVDRDAVQQYFQDDRGQSVVRIPLDVRRNAIEEMPWVESATVQRILPNHIRVEVTERTPVAFVRNGTEISLIDGHGVLLDVPLGAEGKSLTFPILTGLSESMSREERGKRVQIYQEFMKAVDLVRANSSDHVSEVDLSNAKDLRVVMTGISGADDSQAVTIHFGQDGQNGQDSFATKYRMVVENFPQWQVNNGKIQSVDLQYSRQVVLNPDSSATTAAKK